MIPMILGITLVVCLLIMIFVVPDLVEYTVNSGNDLNTKLSISER